MLPRWHDLEQDGPPDVGWPVWLFHGKADGVLVLARIDNGGSWFSPDGAVTYREPLAWTPLEVPLPPARRVVSWVPGEPG